MKILDFILYNSVKSVGKIIFRFLYKIEIVNEQAIPTKGGILLAGNHSSWLDTLFLNYAIKRPLYFVTGDFIFRAPVLGKLVKHMGAIPMTKSEDGDSLGLETAIQRLKEGNVLCIFPEGKLSVDGKLGRFRNGVSIIQKETGAKILPFYLHGAIDTWSHKQKKIQFFKKIKIEFGEPILPTKEKDSEIAKEIQEKVKELINN